MKITIEHESATRLNVNKGLQKIDPTDAVLLDFTLEKQQLSNWCWAAIAASVGRFYGTSQLSQRQIVCELLALSPERLPANSDNHHVSNQQITLDRSLALVNCDSRWSTGRPSYEQLLLEISSVCLPCARIDWRNGGAHYLVIKGINIKAKNLYIEDSLNGPASIAYQDFPRHYLGSGGVWTDTFWATPQSQQPPNNHHNEVVT